MNSLPEILPDVDFLLTLPVEELASIILPLLRKQGRQVHLGNYQSSLFTPNMGGHKYDRSREGEIGQAISEAWWWLEVQCLLVPADGSNAAAGWRRLSRRAAKMADATDVRSFAKSRRIQKSQLHPSIADKVWSAFLREEYDVAVFQAMKAVEVAVRDAGGYSSGDIGVPLMRSAFHEATGPLTDMAAERSERQARSALFAGAIGAYKNSHSHRDVHIEDADEAMELIHFANHLLRIVDRRKAAKS
jgi:uncharacterized protein (TIGR02391 family)